MNIAESITIIGALFAVALVIVQLFRQSNVNKRIDDLDQSFKYTEKRINKVENSITRITTQYDHIKESIDEIKNIVSRSK